MEYLSYYLIIGFVIGCISLINADEKIKELDHQSKVVYEMVGKPGILFVAMLLWPLVIMLKIMKD